MQPGSAKPSWKEWVSFTSDIFGVIGGVGVVVAFILYIFKLPSPLPLIIGTFAFALLVVFILGRVYIAHNQPIEAFSLELRDEPEQLEAHTYGIVAITGHTTAPERLMSLEPEIQATRSFSKESRPAESSLKDELLVCLRVGVIPVKIHAHLNKGYKIFYQVSEPDEKSVWAVVAEFANRPNATEWVNTIEHLRAQITYYEMNGVYYCRIGQGFWIDKSEPYIPLDSGSMGKLIIAVKGSDGKLFAHDNYQGRFEHREVNPPFELQKKRYRVQVCLTASGGLSETKAFELILEHQLEIRALSNSNIFSQDTQKQENPELIAIVKKLNEYLKAGDELLRLCANTSNPPRHKVKDWEQSVTAYIEENIGELASLEWVKAYPETRYPGLAVDRALVNRLYTLLQRLGEIISDLPIRIKDRSLL
jgi:hypothetical protein